jgi:hypothetical protein
MSKRPAADASASARASATSTGSGSIPAARCGNASSDRASSRAISSSEGAESCAMLANDELFSVFRFRRRKA